jgi:hypothetical protein
MCLRPLFAITCLSLSAAATAADGTALITVAGLADSESGTSFDADAYWGPTANWGVGLGVGKIESNLPGADFSGTSFRGSSDVTIGRLNARAGFRQWEDSSQIDSDAGTFEMSWLFDSGLSVALLYEDRSLATTYQVSGPLGRRRNQTLDLDGSGWGADLSWFGDEWQAGIRYLDLGYGSTLDRLRTAISSPQTLRFPGIQSLVDTVLTRNIAPIDYEFSALLGRSFDRASLRGEWFLQRDALTGQDIQSFSLRYGYRFTDHVELGLTGGLLDASFGGSIGFGGLALTLRR